MGKFFREFVCGMASALLPLDNGMRLWLCRRFTVEYNYNSNSGRREKKGIGMYLKINILTIIYLQLTLFLSDIMVVCPLWLTFVK